MGIAASNGRTSRAFLPLIFGGLLRVAGLLALTALGSLALMRYAPGFASDDRHFDLRFSAETLESIGAARQTGYWELAGQFARGAATGNLGTSESLGYPVAELIRDRAPVTLRGAGLGVALAWMGALALVAAQIITGSRLLDWLALMSNQAVLVVPSGLIAFFVFVTGAPASLAIAAIVFPHVFRYAREFARDAFARPHVLAARARGSSRARLFAAHVAPNAMPSMIALLGTSVAIGLSASIPVEALGDVAGLGQLAWKAALARDLPLLLPLALLVAGVALLANCFADVVLASRKAVAR